MRSIPSTAAVVVCASSALLLSAGAGVASRLTGPSWVTVGAVRATVATRFYHRYFTSCSYRVTGVRGACVRGIVLADYRLQADPEIGASGARYPRDHVALELVRAAEQHPPVVAPAVSFPLSLADLRYSGRGLGSRTQRELFFRVAASNYWAIAWVGPTSTKVQRLKLASVVASIRRV